MADSDAVSWSPIYVLSAGYKKLNGAYVNAGNYEGRLRYKHPKEMIWCFYNGGKEMWCFSNKSRFLEDGKVLYKNKHNTGEDDPVPMRGWKYSQSPGTNPPPKVINSAFVEGEDVDIYSKKAKKWIDGKIMKVNDKGTYKCKIKGVKKAINIPRDQIRMLDEHKYTVKQFVEIKTKGGDWLLAMIAEVKESGKYYIVLPDGKAATFPESKIRPTEMCRDGDEDGGGSPAAAPAAASHHAPKAAATGGDNGSSAALLAEKDQEIAMLKRKVAQLESSKGAPSGGSGGPSVNPNLIQEILDKQKELEGVVADLKDLQIKLVESLLN